jgi:hypothetical protein
MKAESSQWSGSTAYSRPSGDYTFAVGLKGKHVLFFYGSSTTLSPIFRRYVWFQHGLKMLSWTTDQLSYSPII